MLRVALVIFTQFVDDDLGCASLPRRRRGSGQRRRRRPGVRDRAVPRRGRAARRPDRAHDRDAHARRPRLRATAGSRSSTASRSASTRRRRRLPARPDRGRRRDRASARSSLRCIHTPGHRPEHCCLAVDRPLARRRAVARAHRRLALRRRRRAARPRGRGAEGAEGLFHSLRRLLELGDGVEVYPGHVAGSLCGKAMSSKASTTIGFERRFNPTLQLTTTSRVHRRVRGDLRAEAAEHGADRRAEPRAVRRRAARAAGARRAARGRAAARRAADVRRISPATCRARSAFPSPARASRRRRLRARRRHSRSSCSPRPPTRPQRAIRGPPLGRPSSTSPATCSEAATSEPTLVAVDELDALIAAGAEVIDVREKDERDTGYIPGSRNIPYRLIGIGCGRPPARPADRHDLRDGPARGDRREHPRARGFDAHPVVDGGIDPGAPRGGDTVEFRRCGSASSAAAIAARPPRGRYAVAPTLAQDDASALELWSRVAAGPIGQRAARPLAAAARASRAARHRLSSSVGCSAAAPGSSSDGRLLAPRPRSPTHDSPTSSAARPRRRRGDGAHRQTTRPGRSRGDSPRHSVR